MKVAAQPLEEPKDLLEAVFEEKEVRSAWMVDLTAQLKKSAQEHLSDRTVGRESVPAFSLLGKILM